MTLDSLYALKKTGEYSDPKRASDVIPVVYGDWTENSGNFPVVPCPCVNDTLHVYALSAGSLLTAANGNTFRFWDEDGDEIASSAFSVTPSIDYESNGTIAIVTFTADYGDVTGQYQGKVDPGGTLITNPIDVFEDIVGGASALHRTSFAKARALATTLGYTCAGAIVSEHQVKTWLNNLAASFLMDWYTDADQKIKVRLDSSNLAGLEPAFVLEERHTSRVEVFQYATNIQNQVPVYYAPSYAKADRRFREGVNANYLKYDSGATYRDADSSRRYGVHDQPVYTFDWTRNTATVNTIQQRIVDKFAHPVNLIQWPEVTKQAMQAEKGDFGVYANSLRINSDGDRMTARYVQLLEKNVPLIGGGLGLYLRETNIPYVTDLVYWDGTRTLGDGGTW